MSPCDICWLLVSLFFVLIIALLLHHKIKHGNKNDQQNYLPDIYDQWFQCSDVGNFRSCSHEMWIVFLVVVLLVTAAIGIQMEC